MTTTVGVARPRGAGLTAPADGGDWLQQLTAAGRERTTA